MAEIVALQDIVKRILELVSRTSLPSEKMENYVNRVYEEFKWEGVPYVEVQHDHYVVTIYERGVPTLTKTLQETNEVIYWLLEDFIFTAVHVQLLKRYGVDNKHTHLKYTREVMNEIEQGVQQAFEQIGEPHLSWHMTGKRRELERL